MASSGDDLSFSSAAEDSDHHRRKDTHREEPKKSSHEEHKVPAKPAGKKAVKSAKVGKKAGKKAAPKKAAAGSDLAKSAPPPAAGVAPVISSPADSEPALGTPRSVQKSAPTKPVAAKSKQSPKPKSAAPKSGTAGGPLGLSLAALGTEAPAEPKAAEPGVAPESPRKQQDEEAPFAAAAAQEEVPSGAADEDKSADKKPTEQEEKSVPPPPAPKSAVFAPPDRSAPTKPKPTPKSPKSSDAATKDPPQKAASPVPPAASTPTASRHIVPASPRNLSKSSSPTSSPKQGGQRASRPSLGASAPEGVGAGIAALEKFYALEGPFYEEDQQPNAQLPPALLVEPAAPPFVAPRLDLATTGTILSFPRPIEGQRTYAPFPTEVEFYYLFSTEGPKTTAGPGRTGSLRLASQFAGGQEQLQLIGFRNARVCVHELPDHLRQEVSVEIWVSAFFTIGWISGHSRFGRRDHGVGLGGPVEAAGQA